MPDSASDDIKAPEAPPGGEKRRLGLWPEGLIIAAAATALILYPVGTNFRVMSGIIIVALLSAAVRARPR